jgi:DNA repair photolyase
MAAFTATAAASAIRWIMTDAHRMLAAQLQAKRKKCMVGTGAMTDPYIPLEGELEYTRRCLEVIDHNGFGLAIQTKSDGILRDLDLLKSINAKTKCVVQMTLTTYNEDLCKIVEPNVCTTRARFEVLQIMRDNGIPTVVWLTPLLPFINDDEKNLRGILDYCIQAQVYGIINFGIGLTLREGNREYFYRKLDEHFPGLKQRYQRKYGNSYEVNSDNHDKLMRILRGECQKHIICCNNDEIFKYMSAFEEKRKEQQMGLPMGMG